MHIDMLFFHVRSRFSHSLQGDAIVKSVAAAPAARQIRGFLNTAFAHSSEAENVMQADRFLSSFAAQKGLDKAAQSGYRRSLIAVPI